jgi:hypothetical protein
MTSEKINRAMESKPFSFHLFIAFGFSVAIFTLFIGFAYFDWYALTVGSSLACLS